MRPNYPLTKNNNRFWLIALLIFLLTISCGVLEVRLDAPDQEIAPQSNPDQYSEGQPSDIDTSPEQYAEQKLDTLNPSGPWLVFITGTEGESHQIWAANPDGSAMTVLADNAFVTGYRGRHLRPQISPNGHHIAYIEVQDQPLTAFLRVIDLATGDNNRVMMLYDESQVGYQPEMMDVILNQASSLAWSPDGRTLGLIGAMEGGSADLYVHNPEEQSVARVSDGPGQAYMPVWSADGKLILHTATSQFHRGEWYSPFVFTPDGLWALNADTYINSPITWPYGNNPEFIKYFPWYGSTFAFVGTGSPCQSDNGCWLDVVSGETGVFPFPIVEYAISPQTGGLLATSFQTTMPSDTAGAYLFTPQNPDGTLLFDFELDNIQWLDQAGVFSAQVISIPQLQALQISTDGIVTKSSNWDRSSLYMEMKTSPNGKTTAWYGYVDENNMGLWLGSDEDQNLVQITSEPVFDAVWSPDSEWVFFTVDEYNPPPTDSDQGLYVVHRDGEEFQFLFVIPAEDNLEILGFTGK